jgi:N-acylneuraminate cytidylyltransferase
MVSQIAIILARSGSKRLKHKNILDFGGKPMLAWSVEAALESNCFDRVLVSTDSEEFAEIARQYGAEVPFLRNEAADDHSPASIATRIAGSQAENYWHERYDTVAQLLACCPLRTASDIRRSLHVFEKRDAVSQISCFRFGWMNPWWATDLDSDGNPIYLFPEARNSRSQDLPVLYCPSGALWLAKRDSFMSSNDFYMPRHTFFPLDWISAMDIDTNEDLLMARACLEIRKTTEFN